MNNTFYNGWDSILGKLPNVLIALAVLLVGWLVAKIIEKAVYKGLQKTSLDNKLFSNVNNKKYSAEKIISKIVYVLILVFVFIMFLKILDLYVLTEPLIGMFSTIAAAIPNILKAGLILLFAWLIASALKFLIQKGGKTLGVHEKLSKYKLTEDNQQTTNVVDTVANIVFYLVLLMALPAVLSALNLRGVSEPFENMIEGILSFIPKLFAAALILLVGYFVAKIVRDILTNFLQSIGTEKLVQRFGLSRLFEGTSLSRVIGTVAFVLILIPTVIAALERLDVEGISQPAIAMLNDILTMIPNIVVAIILVMIGLWLGKWLKKFTADLLRRIGFDSYFKGVGLGSATTRPNSLSLSEVVGYIVQVIVVLLFVAEALNVVKLDFFVDLARGVIAYLPHVIAAIVILGVGLWLGGLVKRVLSSILQGDSSNVLATVAKYAIITITVFMALDQLGVAPAIVNAAFILTLGGLALAFGLAFGLGGKNFASKYLTKLDEKIEKTSIDQEAVQQQKMKKNNPNPATPPNLNNLNQNPGTTNTTGQNPGYPPNINNQNPGTPPNLNNRNQGGNNNPMDPNNGNNPLNP
ncbi:mechanosensitive ion channel [Bacillus sp. ISL-35]|uniref:mechanosensitive ion channel n=1 Tax=Bacillus sp. ISL-35 TaxID=2819122 RepID=UPI001BE601B8|nr:mechanosensitive ion channel [Bacillus sp. ISL-35]MBT2681279.1 mechanosensitive ion channel [Bacillus sp. ISL-35]MBT2705514.1 mechanosensitive ion channel [Chryseobacterium sp. ISL-80]